MNWEHGWDAPSHRTVLVIDECGMAGVRDLEAVVTRTVAAGGRVVLVGDHHQLPEITAGGGFAAAVDEAVAAELTVNRRQHHRWEQAALTHLRDGNIPTAVTAYRDHDRVVVTDDRAAMIAAAIDRWLDARHAGHHPILLAGTVELVDGLNQAARNALTARGELCGDAVGTYAGRMFVVGDRVVLRRNSARQQTADGHETIVANGQAATVIGGGDGRLRVVMDRDGAVVELGASYIRAGWVDHGYALTTHRAQGGTWDQAIAVGVDGLYREAAYVQLSRGRQSNWLIVTRPELADIDAELARHDTGIPLPGEKPGDAATELTDRLTSSRARSLAVVDDPDAVLVAHLAATRPFPILEAAAVHAVIAERRARDLLAVDPDQITLAATRAEHTARHARPGMRLKAHDRHNIGTIVGLDDDTGAVQVEFVSTAGYIARRNLPWSRVELLDEPGPSRCLSSAAQTLLATLHADVEHVLARWRAELAAAGVQPGDASVYARAVELAVDHETAHLGADPPVWLTDVLGHRPPDPQGAQVWDDTTRAIARWQLRHDLRLPTIDHPPCDAAARDQLEQLIVVIARGRTWLDTLHTPTPTWRRARSHVELTSRRAELDTILATAPEDQRHLISALQRGDQLPLADAASLIDDAVAAHDERKRWILTHWPHVVEYSEITRCLDTGDWGPDIPTLLADLAAQAAGALAQAISDGEPWVDLALGTLTGANETTVDAATAALLADVAGYRRRWHVTTIEPLGGPTAEPGQPTERAVLTAQIEHDYGVHLDADGVPSIDQAVPTPELEV
jgi:hypothetical protein